MPENEKSRAAVPTKCSQCHAEVKDTVVCDYCKSVNPAAAMMDYFTLLGVPETFDLDPDELRRKYLVLSRHAHPDYHAQDREEVQQLHLQVASSLNEAYQTLRAPASRAAYLLERLGGKSLAEDKSVPEGFLGTMMMMQEEVEEALQADNADEKKRLQAVLQTQHDGLLRRIAELFKQYQEAVACRVVTEDLLSEIRKQVNAVSYVKKLLSQAKS